MSLPWAASNICETDGIWIKNIGMFEKVVIDKADEDENSVLVLRKCWCLWYLVSFSPWSSCLPNGSILVPSTPLSLSVALAASQAVMFPTLSPVSPEFTDTCPYFWLPSYQMAPSECPTGPSAQHVPNEALISKNPQTCLRLDSGGPAIYPIAPISPLCSLFTFYIPWSTTSNQHLRHVTLPFYPVLGLFALIHPFCLLPLLFPHSSPSFVLKSKVCISLQAKVQVT